MKEEVLHYVWRTRRFDFQNLITTEGEAVEIIAPGTHNTHAGPDFFDARVRIGGTLWAGNVEMHLVASEWETHRHGEDRAYDNVVLHVVWEEDLPVLRSNGERIPCIELKKRIPAALIKTYRELLHNEHWIPCQHHFHRVPDITRQVWLDRLMVERLEAKTAFIAESLERTQQHWEETFYQILARNFGLKVNAEPFEALARSLPLNLLSKHKNNLLQLEALLFGQAGLLEGVFEDDYPQRLQKEYAFLQHKYSLQPIAGSSWKFLRMRPANFPSLRIAQFATLIHQSAHLFSKIYGRTKRRRNRKHVRSAPVQLLANPLRFWQGFRQTRQNPGPNGHSPARDQHHRPLPVRLRQTESRTRPLRPCPPPARICAPGIEQHH